MNNVLIYNNISICQFVIIVLTVSSNMVYWY